MLTTDHHEVTALIGEIWVTTDAEKRRDLADTVISELVRHSVAEEMYVYPAMRKHLPDGDAAVEHDTTEHKQLESTMKQLEAVDASDPQFTELLRQLETILADHVADEERDQFPQLRARIPREGWCRWPGRSRRPRRSLRRGRTRARRTTRSSTSWWAPASASWTACATSSPGARTADVARWGGGREHRSPPRRPVRRDCRRPTSGTPAAMDGEPTRPTMRHQVVDRGAVGHQSGPAPSREMAMFDVDAVGLLAP